MPSEPSEEEAEGPLDRELERALEAALLTRPPLAAERAERSVEPPPPAEEASESPLAPKAEPPPPPPDAALEVLASAVPAEATELPLAPVRLAPELDEEDEEPPPPDVATTVTPPRPDIWTETEPPEEPIRPPRSEGAIRDTYFSAAVTPVNRSVFETLPDCTGAIRTATTVASAAFAFCFSHAQYPAPAAATSRINHTQPYDRRCGTSGGVTTCGPDPDWPGAPGSTFGTAAPDICIGVVAIPGFMSDCGENIKGRSSPLDSGPSCSGPGEQGCL
jgi:hypothetical protein